ncbi:MAG TPA: uracil-DNA glycosylase [Thermodesulfobacteriaceae bacterium]|nr:uracil-DNA glycosylase [Thermodesulfobacteriaceae bacterium]
MKNTMISASRACSKCRYYYITWDRVRPYGCRAYGLKTRRNPREVVRESSGEDCSLFSPAGISRP